MPIGKILTPLDNSTDEIKNRCFTETNIFVVMSHKASSPMPNSSPAKENKL
jgi:hypothetical protein